jgi:helicase
MQLVDIKQKIPELLYNILDRNGIKGLRPCQEKSIVGGLLENKSLLVCTPTASGKTLVAELAMMNSILTKRGKAVYIVPLKALANEKYKDFTKRYGHLCNIALAIGDKDSPDYHLANYELIITTSEKLDSLLRHNVQWMRDVNTVVVDEIHLLNDPSRGPTLEILITMLRMLLKNVQILALSATIGNPAELAKWLDAELIIDNWRPVELRHGVYMDGKIQFY